MDSWIQIPLTKNEVLQALQQSLDNTFIDNLRHRHPNVALDSKLRGYVGEFAFKKWLQEQGITALESNIMDESSSMDIDFLIHQSDKDIQLELKTSLIPDADGIFESVAKRRDIKLICRGDQNIESLKGDVHVQLFFKQLRIRKDEWLEKQNINLKSTVEKLYDQLAAFRYEKDTYLAAWIDKKTLVKQINKKPTHLKQWKYGQRKFWCCNINNDAKAPIRLVDFLKEKET